MSGLEIGEYQIQDDIALANLAFYIKQYQKENNNMNESIEMEIWNAKKEALMFLLRNYFTVPAPKPELSLLETQISHHELAKPQVVDLLPVNELEDHSEDEEKKTANKSKGKKV